MSDSFPLYVAAERVGEIPPWIRRTRVPGSSDLIVQCMQCGWQFTAITGAQAMFAARDHQCWRSP